MIYANKLPETIRLSTPDLAFLIPETEDETGVYFPMCPVFSITLKRPLKPEDLIAALRRVHQRFPQFRLGYKLDYVHNRWQRIPDGQLDHYWPTCVEKLPTDCDVNEQMGEAIATNIAPLSQPILFQLNDHHLLIKIHHSMGDGKYMFQLISSVLTAAYDPAAFEKLPELPAHFGLPLWKLIFQTPQQGFSVVWGFLKSVSGYYKEFKQETTAQQETAALTPIISGSPMRVVTRVVTADAMKQLNDLKNSISHDTKITLNTLLQTLVGLRVAELELTTKPPIYSIPVDLRRYLKNPTDFYPGNLISQIRIKSNGDHDLLTECTELQNKVDAQLSTLGPLIGGPGECLTALNMRTYKLINRKWLLASFNTDPRLFIFSNVGSIDTLFNGLAGCLDLSEGLFASVPLMGGPPLVLSFSIVAGQGNVSMTYDPRRFSQQQAEAVVALFDLDWLAAQFPQAATEPVPA